jgi:hypothetical protein
MSTGMCSNPVGNNGGACSPPSGGVCSAGQCVQCLTDANCAGNTPSCDIATHTCRCRTPSAGNLIINGGFDSDFRGWDGADLTFTDVWTNDDSEGCPFSGSLNAQNGENGPFQCLRVSGNTRYFFGAKFKTNIPTDFPNTCSIYFNSDQNCLVATAPPLFAAISLPNASSAWLPTSTAVTSPPDAQSALMSCTPFFANMDEVYVNPNVNRF